MKSVNSKKQTQGQIFETVRGELGVSQEDFCAKIGVSRQWYSPRLKSGEYILDVQSLSVMALDQQGSWLGQLAVDLLKAQGDERFIPCRCETEIGDRGECPKHTPSVLRTSPPNTDTRIFRGEHKHKEVAA